jgi:hypothetical protein
VGGAGHYARRGAGFSGAGFSGAERDEPSWRCQARIGVRWTMSTLPFRGDWYADRPLRREPSTEHPRRVGIDRPRWESVVPPGDRQVIEFGAAEAFALFRFFPAADQNGIRWVSYNGRATVRRLLIGDETSHRLPQTSRRSQRSLETSSRRTLTRTCVRLTLLPWTRNIAPANLMGLASGAHSATCARSVRPCGGATRRPVMRACCG